MPYPKSLIERFATSAQSLHRVIENAHKAVKQDRIDKARELLALFYGRQMMLLERDIEAIYKREETKRQMKGLMVVNNFTQRVLVESSLAYSEKPIVKIRSKLMDAQGQKKTDPVMPGAILPDANPADAVPAAAAKPESAQTPGDGGAPNTAGKKKSEGDLTRIWNERVDARKNFWPAIKEAEPLAHGLNDIAIVASYRNVDDQPRMTWDLFPPDTYIVVQQLEAPDEPVVIALDQYIDDTDPLLMTDSNLINRAFRVIFTKDKVRTASTQTGNLLDVSWFPVNIGDANPYGFIPIVVMRHGRPEPGSFFGCIAEDLLTVNRQYNLLSTQIRLAEMYQAHGIFWIKGLPDDMKDEVDTAPGSVIELEDDGQTKGGMGYVSATMQIHELEQRRLNMVREIADNYGLSPSDIMQTAGAAPRSGKAMQIISERLVERTERFREATEETVKTLIKKSLLIWKRWNADDPDAALIPEKMDDIEVELRFGPLRRAQDEQAANAERRQKIKDGLDTWENWYMEEHPEAENAEEARSMIMANKQSNEALNPAAAALTATINGLRQPGAPPSLGPVGKPIPPAAGQPAGAQLTAPAAGQLPQA
jgi:hypothetical protein